MNDEELKEMLKLYTKKDLWEFNQIKAKKQIELMAQIKEQDQKIKELQLQLAEKNELFIATKWKVDDLEKQLAEKEKEIEIEKEVSSWLYNIHNRTGFEQEVSEKFKTATEVTAQCQLYEYCKNQYINDLRSEVKKKLKN